MAALEGGSQQNMAGGSRMANTNRSSL